MLLHLIADFGVGDLAFAEVTQRLKAYLPEAEVIATSVPPFATLAAGFCAAQLGLGEAPEGSLIFHNVAPRKDDTAARRDNDGERLTYASLANGVVVVGVHAGYAFSFLRDAALEFRYVQVPSAGSQFRSRDLFPAALARIARRQADALGATLERDVIPEIPAGRVAYVDGFGNVKTTFRHHPDLVGGSPLAVTVAGVTRETVVATGGFAVPDGSLAFASGSSGWLTASGERLRWMELFLRGGSAWEAFGRPAVGAQIELTPRPLRS